MEIKRSGIGQHWLQRATLVRWAKKMTVDLSSVTDYARHIDKAGEMSPPAPPGMWLLSSGQRLLCVNDANLFGNKPWERPAVDALGYVGYGARLEYFFHNQFGILYPDHISGLHQYDWEGASEAMAFQFTLGLCDDATYLGYLSYAALNRSYQLRLSYHVQHRRVHALLLRLFAVWRGDVGHFWPPFAFDEPVYEGLLEHWNTPDPQALVPWLLAACDRHTHEGRYEKGEKTFYDCSPFPRTPLEILMLFRLREMQGLANPVLDHPLMDPPFDRLPAIQAPYVPDELIRGVLKRVREDWPTFDEVTALEALKAIPPETSTPMPGHKH